LRVGGEEGVDCGWKSILISSKLKRYFLTMTRFDIGLTYCRESAALDTMHLSKRDRGAANNDYTFGGNGQTWTLPTRLLV